MIPIAAISARLGWILCAAIAAAALGFGLFAQMVWHMRPCPWCILQRLIYGVILLASLAGVLLTPTRSVLMQVDEGTNGTNGTKGTKGTNGNIAGDVGGSSSGGLRRGALLGMSGSVILMAVAGIAAAGWQSFGPIDAAGCALTLADRIVQATGLDVRLPLMFSATANCDEANVPLLGIPFAIWSLLTFAVIAAVMAFVARCIVRPPDIGGGGDSSRAVSG